MENQFNQPQNPNAPLRSLPNATAVLVLGIVSIVFCFCYYLAGFGGLACGIIALYLANKDKKLYEQNPSQYLVSSYNNLKAGRICAIIGIVLCSVFILIVIVSVIFFGVLILHDPQQVFQRLQHQ